MIVIVGGNQIDVLSSNPRRRSLRLTNAISKYMNLSVLFQAICKQKSQTRQPVWEKKESDFKPAFLRLKIVSDLARGRGVG